MARLIPAKTDAAKFFEKGIAACAAGRLAWRQAKENMLDAGFYFLAARDAIKANGDFNDFIACYEAQIARSTVYKYIAICEACLAWALAAKPSLKGDTRALIAYAKKARLESPREWVALMRELGEMRKFGEYDAVKYKTRKLIGQGQQLELDFSKAISWIDTITQIDHANLQLPDELNEPEALQQLEDKLDLALTKVRAARSKLSAVDLNPQPL